MKGGLKKESMLRSVLITEEENKIIDEACMNSDGSKLPRPVFYHNAIVAMAKQIIGERYGNSNN